jgi:hypothetical protein
MTRLTIHIHNRKQLDDFLELLTKHGVCCSIEGPDLHYEDPRSKLETQKRKWKRRNRKA